MARSLWPREHGAYVELLAPLLTALILAPTLPGSLTAIAAALAFVANESLLVMVGARGARAKKESGDLARRRLTILGLLALGAGVGAVALAPNAARVAFLAPALPGVLVWRMALDKAEKTLPAEMLVVVALSTLALPVIFTRPHLVWAGGAAVAATWMIIFWGQTLTVHAVKARHRAQRHRKEGPPPGHLVPPVALALSLLSMAPALLVPERLRWPAWALWPPAMTSLWVLMARVPLRQIKRVGVIFAIADTLSMALMLIGACRW